MDVQNPDTPIEQIDNSRMMPRIDTANAPVLRMFVASMSGKEPFVLVDVACHEGRWFVVGGRVFGVDELERCEAASYRYSCQRRPLIRGVGTHEAGRPCCRKS